MSSPALGATKQLLSDRGPEFESQLFAQLIRLMQIQKLHTTSFEASTNGAVDRFHGTFNSMLAKITSDDQCDWDERMPLVFVAYRAAKHGSTSFSPNFIVFGRENRAPADLLIPEPKVSSRSKTTSKTTLQKFSNVPGERTESSRIIYRMRPKCARNVMTQRSRKNNSRWQIECITFAEKAWTIHKMYQILYRAPHSSKKHSALYICASGWAKAEALCRPQQQVEKMLELSHRGFKTPTSAPPWPRDLLPLLKW